MQDNLVVGFGNPLLSDEGVGIHVIRALCAESDFGNVAEVVDGGTSGMRLVHLFPGRKHVVIVDCARMGTPPGTLRRFLPGDATARATLPKLSVHEGDLLGVISLASRLCDAPPETIVIGIEPSLLDAGEALSPTLAERLGDYVAAVRAEFAGLDVA